MDKNNTSGRYQNSGPETAFRAEPLGIYAITASAHLIDAADLTRSRAAPPACRGSVPPPRRTEARAKRTLYPPHQTNPLGALLLADRPGAEAPSMGAVALLPLTFIKRKTIIGF